MTTEMHVAVMVPRDEVASTWLYELAPDKPVVELHVPAEGNPMLCFQDGRDAMARGWEYRRRSLRWPIPHLVAGEPLWELLAGLQPWAARIVAGLAGGDLGGQEAHEVLTGDAAAAAAELAEHLAATTADMPVVEVLPASTVPAEELQNMVGADATDRALAAIAARLTASVAPSRPGNVVVVEDLTDRLTYARLQARKQVRDRLAIVATVAEGDRRERDSLLRRIARWDDPGDTHRSLGAAAGLSHAAVQKILKKVEERDDALDRIAATITSLVTAWAPDPLPDVDTGAGHDQDEPADWELEDDQRFEDERRRARRAMQTCAVSECGRPSKRIVKRWQVDTTVLVSADPDDPARDAMGHVEGLSTPPRFAGQPTWTVCGTAHARTVIEADRAAPRISGSVPGNSEYHYEVDSFRYSPDDSELPPMVVAVRRTLDLLGHSLEEFARDVHAGDLAGAATELRLLRQAVARGAARLADVRTYVPPAQNYRPGEPEPPYPQVLQVRHGDTIYARRRVPFGTGTYAWYGHGNTSHTWEDLLAIAGDQGLTAIPREVVLLYEQVDDD